MEIINQENESIVFKDECPGFLIEYARNKMCIAGFPSHNYIVEEWETVRVIFNTESKNFNFFIVPMPGFDEQVFPFLALCGEQNITILNVNTHVKKPLINE